MNTLSKRLIAITQRVDIIADYGERRDALDQQWIKLLAAMDALPLLLPNHLRQAQSIVEKMKPDGFLLTGGNSLVNCGGNAPERDAMERMLLERTLMTGTPLLGICRGMQVIQDYFGTPLQRIKGHVTRKQTIRIHEHRVETNSFHDFGAYETPQPLTAWAWADDHVIKAVRHKSAPIMGFMWHPERHTPFHQHDLERMHHFFANQGEST
ncbi:MAG: gamma-glutamyl-gamma-aminobutyrate hydrolase family protein [Magnetococcales bacterium]|nr:gamma-glutamyl-gamma-aminobutyrate hydrolase family protein [Magnetococcales bacterium]